MALDWEKMFRRYVFDEARTPHFVPVAKLTRTQAHYEVLLYALLVTPVCALLGVVALSGKFPHGNVPIVAFYALAAAWATVVFAWNKNQIAGAFSATMPVALLVYFATFGFPPKMTGTDQLLVTTLVVAWAAYNWRIIRIAAAFPGMDDPPDGPKPRKRREKPDYFDMDRKD